MCSSIEAAADGDAKTLCTFPKQSQDDDRKLRRDLLTTTLSNISGHDHQISAITAWYVFEMTTYSVVTLINRIGRIALPRPFTNNRSTQRALATSTTTTEKIPDPFGKDARPQSQFVDVGGRQIEVRDPNHPVVHDLVFSQHQRAMTRPIGNAVEPHYEPNALVDNPPSPKDITLELLMASQAHLGHATSLWHPANAKYIFGIRGPENPIHIISLDATAAHLRRACKIVEGVTERGGLVLFVGNRTGQARAVVKAAKLAQGCHLFSRWIPGGLTNGEQILGKCRKKVVDELDNEVPGFEPQLILNSAIKPDLVVCLNPMENYILLHECGLHNVPTIGVVDTNCNPTWVTYPIPANDDSIRCIELIAGVLGRAGEEGQRRRRELAQQGIVTYHTDHGLYRSHADRRADQANSADIEESVLEQELQAAILANVEAGPAGVEVAEGDIDPSLVVDAAVADQNDEKMDAASARADGEQLRAEKARQDASEGDVLLAPSTIKPTV